MIELLLVNREIKSKCICTGTALEIIEKSINIPGQIHRSSCGEKVKNILGRYIEDRFLEGILDVSIYDKLSENILNKSIDDMVPEDILYVSIENILPKYILDVGLKGILDVILEEFLNDRFSFLLNELIKGSIIEMTI